MLPTVTSSIELSTPKKFLSSRHDSYCFFSLSSFDPRTTETPRWVRSALVVGDFKKMDSLLFGGGVTLVSMDLKEKRRLFRIPVHSGFGTPGAPTVLIPRQ